MHSSLTVTLAKAYRTMFKRHERSAKLTDIARALAVRATPIPARNAPRFSVLAERVEEPCHRRPAIEEGECRQFRAIYGGEQNDF